MTTLACIGTPGLGINWLHEAMGYLVDTLLASTLCVPVLRVCVQAL